MCLEKVSVLQSIQTIYSYVFLNTRKQVVKTRAYIKCATQMKYKVYNSIKSFKRKLIS